MAYSNEAQERQINTNEWTRIIITKILSQNWGPKSSFLRLNLTYYKDTFILKGLSDWAFAIIWKWDFPEEWLQMYWVRQNMINTR